MSRRVHSRRKPGRERGEGRHLTAVQKLGVGSAVTLVAVAGLGMIAGILLDRLLNFDDALDAGGEWDEGGGVFTRWD